MLPNTPDEEDLNELYAEVLAGFAQDPTLASGSDAPSDLSGSPTVESPISPRSTSNHSHVSLPRPPSRPTRGPRAVRPLPPTPGSSSPGPARPTDLTSHRPQESASSQGRFAPRPLPIPGSENNLHSVPVPVPSPRPRGTSDSPVSATPRSQGPHRSASGGTPNEGSGSGQLPARPLGALAPIVPGYTPAASDALLFDTDPPNGYQHPIDDHLSSPPRPRIPHSSSLGVPVSFPHRPSVEHMRSASHQASSSSLYSRPPDLRSPYGKIVDPIPDRSIQGPSQFIYGEPAASVSGVVVQSANYGDGYPAAGINRGNSSSSYVSRADSDQYFSFGGSSVNITGQSSVSRRPTDLLQAISNYDTRAPVELHVDEEDYYDEEEYDDDSRFINFSLLSNIAVQLRDKVPRGTHVKGSIPYPRAFTGKDVVSSIQSLIQRELALNHDMSPSDRRASLQVARSLRSQLFFYEVEWGSRSLQDGVEDVYMFLDDQEGTDAPPEREALPSGVVTILTKCYSLSCREGEEGPCYAYACPRKSDGRLLTSMMEAPAIPSRKEEWSKTVPEEVLASLPESEIKRQTIIHKLISKEEQYAEDLDIVHSVFITPLRTAKPPVIEPYRLDEFIEQVFSNILDLRENNRRLLEVMYVRQREQAPVIQRIGDIFLDAATEFRLAYPIYVGHHPLAERRMKEELEANPKFRLFVEKCSRQHSARHGATLRLDLKHFLNRPAEHLQKYPVLLQAILNETAEGNPDADYLSEAIEAIKNLQTVAQLRTFQLAMGKGPTGKWEWHDLVPSEVRKNFTLQESKRQSIIFELIKGEMSYVKDLESIETMYIRPLKDTYPPIIPQERVNQFIKDVFHNFAELHAHHRKLVDEFQEIQREEHPRIRSITAALFDAALNFREAYMEYIPNYPIAAYRISNEMETNPAFKTFVEECVRLPDAHRLDMKSFINRPIPRLLRYELLLKGIIDETPHGHDDREAIPNVIDVIKALGKETEPGVLSAKQKVELWSYNLNLVFKTGETVDMDLLDEHRSLLHTGKLLRQPEGSSDRNGELFVLLFDNYLVMTKQREKDGMSKYHVVRRPIPLDLLSLVNFTDPSVQRGTGLLRNLRGDRYTESSISISGSRPAESTDPRSVFPCTIHHNGRLGGPYTLYAETAQIRSEWKQKLDEALGLRKVVQESNKVFEIETLSNETFHVPSMTANTSTPAWGDTNTFTGKVTCSVPFDTPDGRGLVAIGCSEGVWIGFRHDSHSMRRVLHLRLVTQCAMLEEFGIFLVLADKSLYAYHIEALVPSTAHTSPQGSQTPEKLHHKDVQFFTIGTVHGRTLLVYMKKKGADSEFVAVEPVVDKINTRAKTPAGFGARLGIRTAKPEWFRHYKKFNIDGDSFDLIFLKVKVAILSTRGFEIMDLEGSSTRVTIPILREDSRLAKRCESSRPLGMFRSTDEEFLLCYNEFGLYVNKRGDPSRPAGPIEWEGTAERVALHAPYIMLFGSRFIEVRHIETGRLAQIITGVDVRCLWDGRGLNTSATVASDGSEEHMVQEARVHGVMNANTPEPRAQPGIRPPRAVVQHVFELIPTIPLYLPGSLSSPSDATYFPPSFSPPRSPLLRPSR